MASERVIRFNRGRIWQGVGPGGNGRILINPHPFPLPHLGELGQRNRLAGDDVFDAQYVQQRRVERLPVDDRLDAVERQFVLRFDGCHVLGVLPGNNRVVAPHVGQVEQPAGVGVKRFVAVGGKAGDAPVTKLVPPAAVLPATAPSPA
jgi:hypothetical protein